MEYKIIPLKEGQQAIVEQLNDLSKEGWELVTVIHQHELKFTPLTGSSPYLGYVAYLKKG